MTENVISALAPPSTVPDTPSHGPRAIHRRPPLAELATPRPRCTTFYGMGTIDRSGRIANRAVVAALGWRPGDRLEFLVAGGVIVARPSRGGLVEMWQKPYVAIPAPIRHRCDLRSGDRVLVVAHPERRNLVVYNLAVLDQVLHEHHTSLLGGDEQ